MTHLSDYSYIDRGLQTVGLLVFLVVRLSREKMWNVFHPRRFQKRELRSLVFLLVTVSLLLLLAYDIITTSVKYDEGFEVSGSKIITKSKANYSADNLSLIQKTDLLWNLACTFKSSALFLLLAMFHHTVKASGLSFMSSREFAASQIYAVLSVCAYPSLQYIFYDDPLLSTVMPQFVYSFECLVIAALCQAANFRFRNLSVGMAPGVVSSRIAQFVSINNMLSISSFMDGMGLGIINIDIIVTSWRNVLHNKFATDFLTKMFNLGFSGTFLAMLIMLMPRAASQKGEAGGTGTTRDQTATHSGKTASRTRNKSKYQVAPVASQPLDLEAQKRTPTLPTVANPEA